MGPEIFCPIRWCSFSRRGIDLRSRDVVVDFLGRPSPILVPPLVLPPSLNYFCAFDHTLSDFIWSALGILCDFLIGASPIFVVSGVYLAGQHKSTYNIGSNP